MADFEKVKSRQQTLRAGQADLQVDMDSVKRRLDALESRLSESAQGEGSAALSDLEERVAAVEARLAGTPPGAVAPGEAAFPGSPAAALAYRAEEVMIRGRPADDVYRVAIDLYRKGKFQEGIAKFREFLRTDPESELADNAQYWIGESYYNQQDYNRAIIELNTVLLKYPKGDRVPGALLALATAFADSGDPIDARLILQKLIGDYGDSDEAALGRQRLQELTQ